uniref:Uncharacterized protein n=1 Tax=Rhizophora mucronata TaxID=61149 RepID=A0A2P2P0H3_RHIMU
MYLALGPLMSKLLSWHEREREAKKKKEITCFFYLDFMFY